MDDDTLVVGLDPMAAYLDVQITPEIIQDILDIDFPVEIQYVSFEEDDSRSEIISWQMLYRDNCIPITSGNRGTCDVYKNVMKSKGIPIPSGGIKTSVQPTQSYDLDDIRATKQGTNVKLTWDRPDFAVKEYKIYTSNNGGISFKYKAKISKYSTSYTLSNVQEGKNYKFKIKLYYNDNGQAKTKLFYSNSVKIPVTTPVVKIDYTLDNIRTTKSGDSITVSWDKPTDYRVKYYKMYVSENGGYDRYKGIIYDTKISYTLTGIDEGKNYKFKIKLYYYPDSNSSRYSTKYFYSDVVDVPRATPPDRMPPVITVPSDITVRTSDSVGQVVTYDVSATDETGGDVTETWA